MSGDDSSDGQIRARRDFMLQALVALPASQLLGACAAGAVEADDDVNEVGAHAQELARELRGCDERVQRRRERWRELHDQHVGRENMHDLSGVMATFSEQAEMTLNHQHYATSDEIAQVHILFGLSNRSGGLANTQVVPERHYYTDDEILIEGKVVGVHVGTIDGHPATNRRVELHYSTFYRFNASDELVSKRIVMNWEQLVVPL